MLETLIAAIILASLVIYALMVAPITAAECGICLPLGKELGVCGRRLLKQSLLPYESRYGRFARALKNSQLTCGDVIIICETVH